MNNSSNKNNLWIQKLTIGFCALATVFCASKAVLAIKKHDSRAALAATSGTLCSGTGLGLAIGGCLLQKKDHD